jgi:hypothetical protein
LRPRATASSTAGPSSAARASERERERDSDCQRRETVLKEKAAQARLRLSAEKEEERERRTQLFVNKFDREHQRLVKNLLREAKPGKPGQPIGEQVCAMRWHTSQHLLHSPAQGSVLPARTASRSKKLRTVARDNLGSTASRHRVPAGRDRRHCRWNSATSGRLRVRRQCERPAQLGGLQIREYGMGAAGHGSLHIM